MDENESRDEKPDLKRVEIRIKDCKRDYAMDQNMKEVPRKATDFELVKLLELEDEVRDEMSQDQF